jgi:Spy/CpxP family protein refolding chaperone
MSDGKLIDDGRGRTYAGSRWKGFWIGVVGVTVLTALLGTGVVLASPGFAGGGFGHGRHHSRGGPWNAEHAREHAGHIVEWIVRWVDASDEQEAQLTQLIDAALVDVGPLAERHRGQREAFLAALVSERVDRDELERIRSEELALAEDASRRLVATLADVADVLTPEQRAELAQLAARMHRR